MDHCLAILEVRWKIAGFLETKSDLIALGMTCQMFFKPSMAVVWRKVEDFTMLFECMPPDLWSFQNTFDSESEWENLLVCIC